MNKRKVISPVKGELTQEECLDCALHDGNICGYDYALLKRLYENYEARPDIHVTDLTMCLRKAYLDKVDPSPEMVGNLINLLSGTMFHSTFEELDDENFESEIPLDLDGLLGRTDLYYKNGTVVDLKTKRWVDATMPVSEHHEWQVRMYGYMLKKAGYKVNRLRIQYVDLAGPSKCRKHKSIPLVYDDGLWLCRPCNKRDARWHGGAILVEVEIPPDNMVEEYIKARKGALANAMEKKEAPAAEVGWLCSYCPHSAYPDKCYEGNLAGG